MSEYKFKFCFYQNITPLHIGCGQDVGLVDNPIIREKTTSFPFIPGSSIRGVLRDRCEAQDRSRKKEKFYSLLGPDAEGDVDYSGCIAVFDAKVLFFPVRTDFNLFHLITCPFVIDRFNRDIKYFKCGGIPFNKLENLSDNLTEDNECFSVSWSEAIDNIFIEEYPFSRWETVDSFADDDQPCILLKNWIESNNFGIEANRILVVNDQVFNYFVRNATMVMQHNRLTSAKTVDTGALFSVESVPPEAIFYGIIGGTQDRKNEGRTFKSGAEALTEFFGLIKNSAADEEAIINLGGDESIGLGVTKMYWKNN